MRAWRTSAGRRHLKPDDREPTVRLLLVLASVRPVVTPDPVQILPSRIAGSNHLVVGGDRGRAELDRGRTGGSFEVGHPLWVLRPTTEAAADHVRITVRRRDQWRDELFAGSPSDVMQQYQGLAFPMPADHTGVRSEGLDDVVVEGRHRNTLAQ